GGSNVAVGTDALQVCTSGQTNTAIGDHALQANTSGYYNTAIGASSMYTMAGGNSNTAVGVTALHAASAGSNNVAIGLAAGYNETASNSFYVGNVQQASLANDKLYSLMYGTFAGSVGSKSGQQLTVNGTLTVAGSVVVNSNSTLSSPFSATLQLGAADAASPVAQTFQVQNVIPTTPNTAGGAWVHNGSIGTGSGIGG